MVYLSTLLFLLGITSFALALSDPSPIKGVYAYEFKDEAAYGRFKPSFEGIADVRSHINGTLLRATTLRFRDLGSAKANAEQLAKHPDVESFHQLHTFSLPQASNQTFSAEDSRHLMQRALPTINWPQKMTQVDKLHSQKYAGKSVRVAVIDSGIDYKHPALGGCFGNGCLVSYGLNFVNNQDLSLLEKPDKNVMDCVGHGTSVAGVIAAQPRSPYNLKGVAPSVTLGAFKISGCSRSSQEEAVVKALLAAVEQGSEVINLSGGYPAGWSTSLVTLAVNRVCQGRAICVIASGNEGEEGMFYTLTSASATAALTVGSFQNMVKPRSSVDFKKTKDPAIQWVDNKVDGGLPSYWTSQGPTWELNTKPNIGAPGDDILVPTLTKNGGWHIGAGTSYSAPFVAGVIALIMEKRPDLRARSSDIPKILAATAQPAKFFDRKKVVDMLAPVPQQGAGLIQALDASEATAVLDAISLSFGDTKQGNLQRKFTISNIGKKDMTFRFRHRPAATAFTFADGSQIPAAFPYEVSSQYAQIRLQPSQFTVQPGQKVQLTATATPPKLSPGRLPVYSGFIDLVAGDKKVYTLPYLGVGGSMYQQSLLNEAETRLLSGREKIAYKVNHAPLAKLTIPQQDLKLPPNNMNFRLTRQGHSDLNAFLPIIKVNLKLGCRLMWIDLVPVGQFKKKDWPLKDNYGLKSIGQLPESGDVFLSRGNFLYAWNGQVHSKGGEYAPAGKYKIVVRVLRLSGERVNPNDYERWDSPEITISYVGE